MIKISKPYIEKTGNYILLKSRVIDEKRHKEGEIFFMTDLEYGQYLCYENADAFVIGLLLPALQSGQDIVVDAPISERLYYNIHHTLVYTLSRAFGFKTIKVIPKELSNFNFDSFAVGCGCSLGVDSFSSMIQHIGDTCPPSYKITHFTYFNIGAHGYIDLGKTRESYLKDLLLIKQYAKIVERPVVCLESNIALFYSGFDFDQCGLIRNMCAVLSLQKLFKKYLYASSFTIDEYHLTSKNLGYFEQLLLSELSTESTELIVVDANLKRTMKTKLIADNELVQKYLYVCWKELIINNDPNSKLKEIKDKTLNCTRCDKCMRTLLTLDILGKTENYNSIFDLPQYYKSKNAYIGKVLAFRDKNTFYKDIYEFMCDNNYSISYTSKFREILYRLKIFSLLGKVFTLFKNK